MFAVWRTEREWPWTDDALGWTGLCVIAAMLVLLTLWTYAGTRRIGWQRLATVLLLRLATLAVTVLLLVRPFYAQEQEMLNDGQLVLVLDYSSSMRITDGPNNQSRWETLLQLLEWPEVKEAFTRLEQEKNIKVYRYQGAEDVRLFDPKSEPDGKRTDIGYWLQSLYQKHKNDRNLRGLLVFSDGQNNGTRIPAVNIANEWRGLRCPVHCFGVGSPATKKGQRDIAVADVDAPQLAFVKTPVKVKATVDAPNLEGQIVTIRLLVEGKEVSVREKVALPNTRGNKIDVGEFVPDKVGEVKVTVKIDEVPGEFTKLNNEMSTYVTVTKEGISVLWVEGRKRLEATWVIRHVLSRDSRFNVKYHERLDDIPLTPREKQLFDFKNKAYDVLVIGDINPARFCGGDGVIFAQIAEQVRGKRTGLLMLGGFNTFGNGDWPTVKVLADILPVDIQKDKGQIEESVPVEPVEKNRNHTLLQIGGPEVWRDFFEPLKGLPKIGPARPDAQLLLVGDNKETVMAVTQEPQGRVAALAADTTLDSWYNNLEAIKAYERFWRQLFVWLARQEDGDNQLQLKLDKRRLSASSNERLGFTVKFLDKKGREVKNALYTVKVIAPDGEPATVKTSPAAGEERGKIGPVSSVGEYKVVVTAKGVDGDGKPIEERTAMARFEGFAEDVENQRPAANHRFLEDVAAAGGGSFHVTGKEELLQLLNDLRDKMAAPGWVQTDVWPNWKENPASESPFDQLAALWHSGALVCFVLFGVLMCTEWFLRRWWGLV